MFDYINANRFSDIGHFIIHPPSGKFVTPELMSKNAIIYTKPDHINYLFEQLRFSGRSYILITHNSDYEIDQSRWNIKPPCIKKWFAINASYDHPDLIPVPMGLEDTETRDGAVAGEAGAQIPWLAENIERLRNTEKDQHTVFTSFTLKYHFANGVWTNPHRVGIYESFDRNGLKYYKPEQRLPYKEYCETSAKYRFHVVPIGHGLENHRTWELLYMGCTPIVVKNRMYKFYDLPILQVDSWDQLTNEFLQEYIDKDIPHKTEQAEITYWRNRINDEFNKL